MPGACCLPVGPGGRLTLRVVKEAPFPPPPRPHRDHWLLQPTWPRCLSPAHPQRLTQRVSVPRPSLSPASWQHLALKRPCWRHRAEFPLPPPFSAPQVRNEPGTWGQGLPAPFPGEQSRHCQGVIGDICCPVGTPESTAGRVPSPKGKARTLGPQLP